MAKLSVRLMPAFCPALSRRNSSGFWLWSAALQAVGGKGHVVVDPLLLRGAVEHRAQFRGSLDEGIGVRELRARLEEHVLVHVRQAFAPGLLGEGPVSHVELDRRDGHAVVLGYDDLEAVRQHALVDELLQFGPLRPDGLRSGEQQERHGRIPACAAAGCR